MKTCYPLLGFLLLVFFGSPDNVFAQVRPVGADRYTAIDAGLLNACRQTYSNTQNNSPSSLFGNFFDTNQLGQPSDDIFYKFTLASRQKVTISHCGSGFDTFISLLDANGTLLTTADDTTKAQTSCTSTRNDEAFMQRSLPAGTYYVVSEGFSNYSGSIITTISVPATPPPGATLSNAIDAGTLASCGAVYTDTQRLDATSCFGDEYPVSATEAPRRGITDDIYYKFSLTSRAEVTISHCNTGLAFGGRDPDTYMHLLNGSGGIIESRDDDGAACSGGKASIRQTLAAGTYYVVSELYNSVSYCNLTTTITTTPIAAVSVTAQSNTLMAGSSTTLTASATGATAYSWSPATGLSATTGGTVTATPARTTTYTVTTTGQGGCSQNTASITIIVNTGSTVPSSPALDQNLNWTIARSYDLAGNLTSESKQFSDALGRPTQAQAKNIAANQVFATQTINNSGGQPVLSTLAAPIYNQGFKYQSDFTSSSGHAYTYTDFEGKAIPNTLDKTTPGTLGYYYSSNNAWEPATAATDYPYSLSEPSPGPLGGIRRAAGPAEGLHMGSGHELRGRSFPLLNEMDHYSSLRPSFLIGSPTPSLRARGTKSVSINQNGIESISFANQEGQTLATCLSGNQYLATTLTGTIDANPANGANPVYQDIHIDASASNTLITLTGSGSSFILIDLKTDVQTPYSGTQSLSRPPGFYRLVATSGQVTFSYPVRYGNFSYSYYDDAGRVIATVAPNGVTPENLVKNPSFDQDNNTGQTATTASSWQTVAGANGLNAFYVENYGGTHSGDVHGTHYYPWSSATPTYYAFTHQLISNLPTGSYTLRAWVKGTGNQSKAYLLARDYDAAGSYKVVSVAATSNGAFGEWQLVEIKDIPVTNGQCKIGFESDATSGQFIYFDDVAFLRQATTSAPAFVTRYTYDTAGQLLSTTSPNEGTSQYVYARDGRIRFSQSAQQATTRRFSYSNYDDLGRVVESGEYQMANDQTQGLVFEPALAVTQVAEAEEGTIVNAGVGKYGTSYSGTGFVDNITQSGLSSVTLSLNVPTQGTYSVEVRYASREAATASRTMSVYINGVYNQQASFAGTTDWTKWGTATLQLPLRQGANTIEYRYGTADNGWINLDYIRLPATSNMVMQLIEAETSLIAYATTALGTYGNNYSGTGFVDYLTQAQTSTQAGSSVTFSLTAPAPASYPVEVRYASADPITSTRTMSVYINGVYNQQASFAGTTDWTAWSNKTLQLPLALGINTVEFRYGTPDNGYINLDYIRLPFTRTTNNSVLATDILENRTRAGGLELARCSQRNQVWYDQAFQDAQLNGRVQEFVLGGAAKTSKDGATTWYSYNDLGQLTWMVQDQPVVGTKTIDYTYDAAGNVLTTAYQQGKVDAFYHHYLYDANQRLTSVSTSRDGVAKTLQATYTYYLHGPLKRVELATNLQGIDYTYTVQGWLKSINDAQRNLDPGVDGPAASGMFKDLFGMRLDYFHNDYRSKQRLTPLNPTVGLNQEKIRYDGSVRASSWHTAASPQTYGMGYLYDAKSQLLEADFATVTAGTFNFGAGKPNSEDNLSYDANGNIGTLRRMSQTGVATDNFTYQYSPGTNKLAAVKNPAGTVVLDYDYDATGQMVRQSDEQGQRYLRYDVMGKVTGFYMPSPTYGRISLQQPLARFVYDDRGFRASKESYVAGPVPPSAYDAQSTVLTQTTYYVRDLSGNILSVYEQGAQPGAPLVQTEIPIYGSSRLGSLTRVENGLSDARYELNDQLGDARVVFHRPTTTKTLEDLENASSQTFTNISTYRYSASPPPGHNGSSSVARFDGRVPVSATVPNEKLVRSERVEKGDTITFTAWGLIRTGFAGGRGTVPQAFVALGAGADNAYQKRETSVMRAPRTGLSRLTNYLTAGLQFTVGTKHNTPRLSATGTGTGRAWIKYRLLDEAGNLISGTGKQQGEVITYLSTATNDTWGQMLLQVRVEQAGTIVLSTGTGDVNGYTYIDDLQVEHTGGMIVQEQHQYAYGSPLTGLNYTVGNKRYRYGYQGQYAEKDAETGYDSFELRMYNARIGRWTSIDPEGQFYSPYVGMGNNPVSGVDPDGGFSLQDPFIQIGKGVKNSAGNGLIRSGSSLAVSVNWGRIGRAIGSPTARAAAKQIAAAGGLTGVRAAMQIARQDATAPAYRDNRIAPPPTPRQAIIYATPIPQYVPNDFDTGIQNGRDIFDMAMGIKGGVKALVALYKVTKAVKPTLALAKSIIPIAGRGNTGRILANTLDEQLAMKEIVMNPNLGVPAMGQAMGDPRWKGWIKMQYVHRRINADGETSTVTATIHYVGRFVDGVLEEVDDFKFKELKK
jgi:RHS repeat-associated protein